MEMCELRNHPNSTIRNELDQSAANQYGQLMKGIGMKLEGKSQVKGFGTFHFINKYQTPKIRK